MSTKISISRTCECCGKIFTAKTTVTRFCSHKCNSKSYKQKLKEQKIEKSNLETKAKSKHSIQTKLDREVFKVNDVADLLEMTPDGIYAMINSGRLKATNLGVRKTRVLRSDILAMFEQRNEVRESKKAVNNFVKTEQDFSKENCYSIKELITLFGKTRGDLYTFLKRKGIPKIKEGKEVYYSRPAVDKLYKRWNEPQKLGLQKERETNERIAQKSLNKKDCYSIEQCVILFGKDRGLLYGIFNRRKVPKLRIGREVFLYKKSVDKVLRTFKEEKEK